MLHTPNPLVHRSTVKHLAICELWPPLTLN